MREHLSDISMHAVFSEAWMIFVTTGKIHAVFSEAWMIFVTTGKNSPRQSFGVGACWYRV